MGLLLFHFNHINVNHNSKHSQHRVYLVIQIVTILLINNFLIEQVETRNNQLDIRATNNSETLINVNSNFRGEIKSALTSNQMCISSNYFLFNSKKIEKKSNLSCPLIKDGRKCRISGCFYCNSSCYDRSYANCLTVKITPQTINNYTWFTMIVTMPEAVSKDLTDQFRLFISLIKNGRNYSLPFRCQGKDISLTKVLPEFSTNEPEINGTLHVVYQANGVHLWGNFSPVSYQTIYFNSMEPHAFFANHPSFLLITGFNLKSFPNDSVKLHFGDRRFDINITSDTCLSILITSIPKSEKWNMMFTVANITIDSREARKVPGPVIQGFKPRTVFPSSYLDIWICGKNLDYLHKPEIKIEKFFNYSIDEYTTMPTPVKSKNNTAKCKIVNATRILCSAGELFSDLIGSKMTPVTSKPLTTSKFFSPKSSSLSPSSSSSPPLVPINSWRIRLASHGHWFAIGSVEKLDLIVSLVDEPYTSQAYYYEANGSVSLIIHNFSPEYQFTMVVVNNEIKNKVACSQQAIVSSGLLTCTATALLLQHPDWCVLITIGRWSNCQKMDYIAAPAEMLSTSVIAGLSIGLFGLVIVFLAVVIQRRAVNYEAIRKSNRDDGRRASTTIANTKSISESSSYHSRSKNESRTDKDRDKRKSIVEPVVIQPKVKRVKFNEEVEEQHILVAQPPAMVRQSKSRILSDKNSQEPLKSQDGLGAGVDRAISPILKKKLYPNQEISQPIKVRKNEGSISKTSEKTGKVSQSEENKAQKSREMARVKRHQERKRHREARNAPETNSNSKQN